MSRTGESAGAIRAPTALENGTKVQSRAGATLTRHPQPVDHDHVDLAGLQRDLRGLRRRELDRGDRDAARPRPAHAWRITSISHDTVPIAQHADADRWRRRSAERQCSRREQSAPRDAHQCFLPTGCAIIPAVTAWCNASAPPCRSRTPRRLDLDTRHEATAAGLVGEPDVVVPGGHAVDRQPLVEIDRAVRIVAALIGSPFRASRSGPG